jgi:hypothetical protein
MEGECVMFGKEKNFILLLIDCSDHGHRWSRWYEEISGGSFPGDPGAVKNTEDAIKQIEQEEGAKPFIDGNPDTFQLVCKFESKRKMKSTKVMNVASGCIVQVTTRELSQNWQLAVAEALTFVPDLNVAIEKDKDGKITKAEFVKVASNA